MHNKCTLQPFVKWAGGKRQLLPEITKRIPKHFGTYHEPFVGGGAILFALQPERAVINDVNSELMNCYRVIRDSPDELIAYLSRHENEKEYYYRMRDIDLAPDYAGLSPVERAARIIYLNHTCFNGLFRVNSHGHFNVPFGRYANPQIVNEPVLRAVHEYLARNKVEIRNTDFADTLLDAGPGDFVYLDPPYDPISDSASFTAYNSGGFSREEQVRLKKFFDALTAKGCCVLLSNSATPFVVDLYAEYEPDVVEANRAINSNATRRGKVPEILVSNYAYLRRCVS
ncbi:modification methylase DpnIIA [Peptococcaceae bacterium CEB3]|nr:modification methylase DpnIIA [Peptococcaceae bacterium CEB3]